MLAPASQEPVRQLRYGDPRPLPPEGEKSKNQRWEVVTNHHGGVDNKIHKYPPNMLSSMCFSEHYNRALGFLSFVSPPFIALIFLARSTHYSVIIPPVFLFRLITLTGTWVVWNVLSAERLYANTTAATLKTKKSFANWIISGRAQV